uniref:Putative zinc-finger domain-containing protein n=1 Tax=candidate division WOR-3 bacterium TaxID=2052148 RepID=A0A7C6AGE4_UNCW3
MMEHEEIEKLIHKRLDKDITKEEEEKLFKHIEKCPQCKGFYLEMERIKQEIFNLTEFFPGPEFNTRVMSAIKVRRHLPWYRVVPIFGVLYLTGLVLLLLTPVPNYLFSKLLLKLPGFVHIFDKIKPVGNGLFLLASSFLQFNQGFICAGFLFSLFMFFVLGKTLKNKEVL